MTVVRVGHSYDGAKWTVNQLLKQPKRVPNLVENMVRDSNIAEWLLRQGPTADGGSVVYGETVALYASHDGEIVAEYAEIPGVETPVRTEITRATTKRGVHLKISKEMETRNDVGRVQDEMRMVRDTLVNTRDKVFFQAVINHPSAQTFVATNAAVAGGWLGTAASVGIRKDIARAMFLISSVSATGAQLSETLNYQADTLIVHPATVSAFIDSNEVNSIFAGSPLASESLRYTGVMPKKFMSLDVMTSFRCPVDLAIVCQRNVMGFISKEWPLSGTPMRYDEDTQTYRSNFSYRDLVAIDNPKSVCFITNIDGP
jgi:hypothetical protein